MVVNLTPLSKRQWKKTLKALAYSFVSAFGGVLATTNFALTKTGIIASTVAGINAVLVALWQIAQTDTGIQLPPAPVVSLPPPAA